MDWPDYELLDSGGMAKLERFGSIILARPEPTAHHPRALPLGDWEKADAFFEENGGWTKRGNLPETWEIHFGSLIFRLRFAECNKHIGLFPEQARQWQWFLDNPAAGTPKLLNLFGHTGAATLAAAIAGFKVTHVDASKPALSQGRENQCLSNLQDAPIRWIHEDATTWVDRETKRGSKYNAILLDPPTFGRGPKGQVWKNGKDLPALLGKLLPLLDPGAPLFILLNHYTPTLPYFPESVLPYQMLSGQHALFPLDGRQLVPAQWFMLDFTRGSLTPPPSGSGSGPPGDTLILSRPTKPSRTGC
jgi:23S rRNA (cytosine1962-C5)-methyltransferase